MRVKSWGMVSRFGVAVRAFMRAIQLRLPWMLPAGGGVHITCAGGVRSGAHFDAGAAREFGRRHGEAMSSGCHPLIPSGV